MELERDVENYLIHQVKQLNGLTYKWVSPGIRGVPDRIVILAGKLFFVELKRANGSLRKNQQYQIRKLREQGQLVFTVYSKADVDQVLSEIFNE